MSFLEETKILEINQYQKSDKAAFINLECLIKKIDRCKNNTENSSTKSKWTYSTTLFNDYNMVI